MTDKNQENHDGLNRISSFETIAVIGMILAGFAAFGYGAMSCIDRVIQKHNEKRDVPRVTPRDTIDYDAVLNMSGRQR